MPGNANQLVNVQGLEGVPDANQSLASLVEVRENAKNRQFEREKLQADNDRFDKELAMSQEDLKLRQADQGLKKRQLDFEQGDVEKERQHREKLAQQEFAQRQQEITNNKQIADNAREAQVVESTIEDERLDVDGQMQSLLDEHNVAIGDVDTGLAVEKEQAFADILQREMEVSRKLTYTTLATELYNAATRATMGDENGMTVYGQAVGSFGMYNTSVMTRLQGMGSEIASTLQDTLSEELESIQDGDEEITLGDGFSPNQLKMAAGKKVGAGGYLRAIDAVADKLVQGSKVEDTEAAGRNIRELLGGLAEANNMELTPKQREDALYRAMGGWENAEAQGVSRDALSMAIRLIDRSASSGQVNLKGFFAEHSLMTQDGGGETPSEENITALNREAVAPLKGILKAAYKMGKLRKGMPTASGGAAPEIRPEISVLNPTLLQSNLAKMVRDMSKDGIIGEEEVEKMLEGVGKVDPEYKRKLREEIQTGLTSMTQRIQQDLAQGGVSLGEGQDYESLDDLVLSQKQQMEAIPGERTRVEAGLATKGLKKKQDLVRSYADKNKKLLDTKAGIRTRITSKGATSREGEKAEAPAVKAPETGKKKPEADGYDEEIKGREEAIRQSRDDLKMEGLSEKDRKAIEKHLDQLLEAQYIAKRRRKEHRK